MSELETRVTDWLAANEDNMVTLLGELVDIDGGSYDKAGVDAVGSALRRFLENHDVACETIPIETHGDALRATVPGGAGNRPILLMGHRDTVFPKGEPQRRPFRVEDGTAYGPGVADMKAGLVINAFLLAAFSKFGGPPAPVVGLFTGDEEIGSPSSRPIIEDEARKAWVAFNSEPGRPGGNIVTNRKGGVFFGCKVFGKAAHSGAAFEQGHSAIEELARKIQSWHKLTDLSAGRTVNVGLISGGQSVNTVAPLADCQIDMRYVALEDRDRTVAAIEEIATTCTVPGTTAEISIRGEFRPLNQSPEARKLFEHYSGIAKELGLNIESESSGGCADSGFAAAVGTPVLCAVGPVGGNVHSPEEYMLVDTMLQRAKVLALAILRLNDHSI